MFKESDIDFNKLTSTEFEELCFDLLIELGFDGLRWRRGGPDNGRDIEGSKDVHNALTGKFTEKWFFECKRFTKAVPPEQLNSKIAWADAEKPKHLVFFISSYLSNSGRTWLEKIERDKFYKIHLFEEKDLKRVILRSNRIIEKYFSTELQKLLAETMNSWVVHGLIPQAEVIRLLSENDEIDNFTINQLAFIWSVSKYRSSEISIDTENSYEASLDWMFNGLAACATTEKSVLEICEHISVQESFIGMSEFDLVYNRMFVAGLSYLVGDIETVCLYSYIYSQDGEGIEVMVEQNSDFKCHIRHVKEKPLKGFDEAKRILNWPESMKDRFS